MAMGDRQLADHRTASCIELAPWACVRERLPTVLRTVLGRPASLAGAQAGLGTTVGTYQRSLCCRFAATGRPFRPRDRRAARQGTGCCDDHDLQLAHQRRPTGSHVGSPRRPFSNPSMSRTIRNGGHDATSAGEIQIVDRSRFRSLAGILLPAVATTASAPKQSWRDVVARPAGPATVDTTRNQLAGASGNVTATRSARWAFPCRAVGQVTHRIARNWQPVTPRGDGDHSTSDQSWVRARAENDCTA